VQARVTEGLTVGFSSSYVNARLTSQPYDGQRVLYVPELTGDASLNYLHQLPAGLTLSLFANESFTGNATRDFVPGTPVHDRTHYSLTNLRIGVGRDNWQASLFAVNLFDAHPIIDDGYLSLTPITAEIAGQPVYSQQTTLRPRTIGVGAKWSF